MLKLIGGLILAGVLVLGISVAVALGSLPDFDELMRSPNGQSVEVRAADGTVLTTLGPSYGQWLPFKSIPSTMADAMISVEDRRFYSHPGVDPIGIGRAGLAVIKAGGSKVQGASTITQQLARNIFLTSNKNYARKLREIVLALALERKFTKEAILELYLNRVYFGGGAYGIDAASRKFFGHSAQTLSLEEAAVIAGLVKAPSRYAPSADPVQARARAATVIQTMVASGAVLPGAAAAADIAGLKFVAPEPQSGVRYFTDWALNQVEGLTDESVEPLLVSTTLDPAGQRAAEASIKRRDADRRAGRPRLDGARRCGQGDGRRPQLRRLELQPCRHRPPPARLVVETVRLSRGTGGRRHARHRARRQAGQHRRLEPAQFERSLHRPR